MLIWFNLKTPDQHRQPQEISGQIDIPDFDNRLEEVKHVKRELRSKYEGYYVAAYGPKEASNNGQAKRQRPL